MYFVPNQNYPCYVVQDSNTIRAYHSQPRNNTTSSYTDYYVNSHYMSKEGSQSWGNTSNLPTCLSKSEITDDFYYRNDFPDILVMFFIMTFVCFYCPWKILLRLFRRFN